MPKLIRVNCISVNTHTEQVIISSEGDLLRLEAEAQPFRLLPSLNTEAKSSPASTGSREVVLARRLTPWEETQTPTCKSSRIRRRAHCNQTVPQQ